MRLADHVTLNCYSNVSTAAVLLDIEKSFDTLHSGLLYKLSQLEYSTSRIKLISSFLTSRKFKVLVESEFSTPRNIVTGVPQGSVLTPILYSLYINDAPRHLELNLPCSRTIPVFTRQRNMYIVFFASCNAASLQ
jgi:hypothetical protein